MQNKGLKEKTIIGMIWSSIGKFGTMGLSFVSNLVLARLLMPEDFGCIGMLQVFIAISGILVTAGFGTALIQKKNPTHVDFSSVFYWNLAMSIVLYVILYLCGPIIANFYAMPELCKVLRIQSLSLIILAFSAIQSCQLQKQLRFKELSVRNIVASLAGAICAIIMALCNCGVWSLVASSLVGSITNVLLLWKMSSWRPSWEFSFQSLKELFSFGGLMALSALVETIYFHIQSLIIGKLYSANDLGYFTQARKLESVPTETLSQIVNQVSFPIFATLQDDKEKLRYGVKKNIKAISYLNFPLMVLLIIIAKPLIILLYGAKWEPAILYFQILCISSMIYTLNTLNTNVIKSLGKGKTYFFLQLSKRLIGIILILIGTLFGIYGLLWACTIFGYVCFIINALVNKRTIQYGLWAQIKDVGGCYLLSLIIGAAVYFSCTLLPIHMYLIMLIQIILYTGIYLLISKCLHMEGYSTYKTIIMERFHKYTNDSSK